MVKSRVTIAQPADTKILLSSDVTSGVIQTLYSSLKGKSFNKALMDGVEALVASDISRNLNSMTPAIQNEMLKDNMKYVYSFALGGLWETLWNRRNLNTSLIKGLDITLSNLAGDYLDASLINPDRGADSSSD